MSKTDSKRLSCKVGRPKGRSESPVYSYRPDEEAERIVAKYTDRRMVRNRVINDLIKMGETAGGLK